MESYTALVGRVLGRTQESVAVGVCGRQSWRRSGFLRHLGPTLGIRKGMGLGYCPGGRYIWALVDWSKKPGTSPSEKQNSPTISPDVITTTPISVRNVPRANNAPLILKLGEEILKFHRERQEQEDGWWQDTARSLSGRSIYSQETSSVFLEIFADRVGRAVKQLKVTAGSR